MPSADGPSRPASEVQSGFLSRFFRFGSAQTASRPEVDVQPQSQKDLIDHARAFQSLKVADVMTPRADVMALELSSTLADVVRQFVESEHSRMPIFRETLDDPVGVAHIKDVMKILAPEADRAAPNWAEPVLHRIRRELHYVPASMRAADLLLKMQASRIHMALVIDEFGGTDGLVTLEDLIEAVVGDIDDEYDEVTEAALIERPNGVLEADGRLPLEDLEAKLAMGLVPSASEEDIGTLAGLVVVIAGRVPQRGEVVPHPDVAYDFEVLDGDPRRIKRIRIRQRPVAVAATAALAKTS